MTTGRWGMLRAAEMVSRKAFDICIHWDSCTTTSIPLISCWQTMGTPVIIDFGSCRQSLQRVGRTYEWYDRSVQQSIPENDWDALGEIRQWLSGRDNRAFKFKNDIRLNGIPLIIDQESVNRKVTVRRVLRFIRSDCLYCGDDR